MTRAAARGGRGRRRAGNPGRMINRCDGRLTAIGDRTPHYRCIRRQGNEAWIRGFVESTLTLLNAGASLTFPDRIRTSTWR